MWVDYVAAANGGGGDVLAATEEVTSPAGEAIPNHAIRNPHPDEVFVVEGVDRDYLATGDRIQLRTADGHYIGLFHNEEDRENDVVATADSPGISETFQVEIIKNDERNAAAGELDTCGPPITLAFRARSQNYLAFPAAGSGQAPLSCDLPEVGNRQKFMLDYLGKPVGCLGLPLLWLGMAGWRKRALGGPGAN